MTHHNTQSSVDGAVSSEVIKLSFRSAMAHIKMIVPGLTLLNVFLAAVEALPVLQARPKSMSGLSGPRSTELVGFLRRFGYLPSTRPQSAPIYDAESVKYAIRQMQIYGGLRPTGNLDNQTLALLSRARCGLPDLERSPSQSSDTAASELQQGQPQSERGLWQKRRITYSFENWLPNVDRRTLEAEMEKAFGIWSPYSGLVFGKEQRKNLPGDISILFARGHHGDNYAFDGPGNILAHAFLPNGNGKSPIDGDIHFDADEEFFVAQNPSQDHEWYFMGVAAHEIGHSLGLSHSPDTGSIMFPYYQTGQPKLGYTDITNLYTKYMRRYLPYDDEEQDHRDSDQEADTTTTKSTSVSTTTKTTVVPRPSIATTTSVYGHDKEPSDEPGLPNICDVEFDSIAFLRNELFVFKDKSMWRLRERGPPGAEYPALISRLFPGLEEVPRIDAAFERDSDGRLLFFSGNKYWEFDATKLAEGSPKAIANFGLPAGVADAGVDAAFIWEKNGLIYFFSGDKFWRYNETSKEMEKNYPQPISRWGGGVPNKLRAVIRWRDAKTYFFKGELFWRFNDSSVDVEDGFPKRTRDYWFNCKQ